ncbi:platelet-activating factor acetylhydrolase IB subunit alpha2-like [Rhopilema esculentum]|uniref:platelet-activating factor acetylhydrolase IB subunit alpha2-like n=1 Tax=Rhopilema esculentum TaxID=499914 RepID=UPI0031D6F697|eukprot:gene16461-7876_t
MTSSIVGKAVEDAQGDGRWMSMHNRFISEGRMLNPKVVFLGDSIVFQMQDKEAWDQYFKPMNALNFGIGGDTVENVLWRLEHGELDCVNPQLFIILVGTNNHHSTVEEVVEGLELIAWTIQEKKPESKILFLGLLPRGEKPNKLRDKNMEVNTALERMVPNVPNTTFLNADPGFVTSSGQIKPSDMRDYLHLTRHANGKVCNIIHKHITKTFGIV